MRLRTFVLGSILAGSMLAPISAQASPSAAAVPGSQFSGYGTPLLVTVVGGPILFANADPLAQHDLVAWQRFGSDDRTWCVLYEQGECPLFWTPLISFSETTPIAGLDAVEAGASYRFYCSIHPFAMKGTLIVLPHAP